MESITTVVNVVSSRIHECLTTRPDVVALNEHVAKIDTDAEVDPSVSSALALRPVMLF